MLSKTKREQLLDSLDRALDRGIADMEAGRFRPAEEVFDRLEAKYTRMANEREMPSSE